MTTFDDMNGSEKALIISELREAFNVADRTDKTLVKAKEFIKKQLNLESVFPDDYSSQDEKRLEDEIRNISNHLAARKRQLKSISEMRKAEEADKLAQANLSRLLNIRYGD